MLQTIWTWVLSHDLVLSRSPFFFLFIAQVTQFVGCCLFSFVDLRRGRVPWSAMQPIAIMSTLGFIPFVVMWYVEVPVVDLPREAPTPARFLAQLVFGGMCGDFLHYCTHRYLHLNSTLRHHVHRVHHEYEGSLYSWIGMQVHPVEVAMITAAIYTPMLLVAHPMVLWFFTFFATMNATCVHSGYEGGLASLGLPHTLTSSDHQLHHELNSTKNYGNILRVWDYLFNTYDGRTRHSSAPG